tara:strand:+ start:31 stop:477 length:447 start_codon:yes stop_codon:yes gene_type:complete
MKKLILLLIIWSFISLNAVSSDSIPAFDNNKNSHSNEVIKKCINEYLQPCNLLGESTDKISVKDRMNSDEIFTSNEINLINQQVKENNDKKNIDTKNKLLVNKSKNFNKVISIDDLPISDINKNISFENFKSSLIKYGVKSNFPDINK